MTEKIKQIQLLFQAADPSRLPELIAAYETDERSSVEKLRMTAQKRYNAWLKEKDRLEQMKQYEYQYEAYQWICGIDEVGRGPLAGPVMAAAVILPKNCSILYLNDSKKLSERIREELYEQILEQAVAVGVGAVDHNEIDRVNILKATYEAMRQAVGALKVVPDLLLNDAVTIPGLPMKQVPIIKGDAKSVSIAAASIVAKVTRDRRMKEYDLEFPEYGFASNKGYGSEQHIQALKKYGPCPIHRRSFILNILGEQQTT